MTPEVAYEYAVKLKALGLAFFPRELQALANVGEQFAKLETAEADWVLSAMARRSKWDPGDFTRIVGLSQAKESAAPVSMGEQARIERYTQILGTEMVWQIDADAEREAAEISPSDPLYQETAGEFICIVERMFRPGHPSLGPPYFERNVRDKLCYRLFHEKCQTALKVLQS